MIYGSEYLPTRAEVLKFCQNSQLRHSEWYKIRDEYRIYEILTQEYVSALAEILQPYKKILEVGAGDGRLSHFLRQRLPNAAIVAIDDYSWGIEPLFQVEKMGIKTGLNKYCPEIVVSSWMPYRVDWTIAFRKCHGLKGYILIGETEHGCCGRASVWRDKYIQDGFARYDLNELQKLQICRTDYDIICGGEWQKLDPENDPGNSSTVFFKRAV